MTEIIQSTVEHINAIAECQVACFPASFGVKLGKATVAKSLEWFILDGSRFLIHIEEDGKIVGFVGGFAPRYVGDGAKSGMFRHSLPVAMKQFYRRPWLFVHEEVRKYAPALFKNSALRIKRKLTSKVPSKHSDYLDNLQLVVIGVHPRSRRKGYAQILLKAFEEYSAKLKKHQVQLSVKQNNVTAIEAYKKAGWEITGELNDTFFMKKIVQAQSLTN